ncbi:hypothetical protein BKA70DRAFT_1221076 [Coprinopsis sp. MPI-PUGE-AT-0042]|nr:hypothetical protein BKA70DRAFT_1221076 [Coprinopsis sp. MPI-PUGE-AT-0042]
MYMDPSILKSHQILLSTGSQGPEGTKISSRIPGEQARRAFDQPPKKEMHRRAATQRSRSADTSTKTLMTPFGLDREAGGSPATLYMKFSDSNCWKFWQNFCSNCCDFIQNRDGVPSRPPLLTHLQRPLLNGKRVHPKHLVRYMRERGIVWGCYCCYGSKFRSSRIGFDGRKYIATCWSDEPALNGCNFYLDLDLIYAMTKEVSEYPHLKPGRVDKVAYSRFVTKFEIGRETLRSVHAIADSHLHYTILVLYSFDDFSLTSPIHEPEFKLLKDDPSLQLRILIMQGRGVEVPMTGRRKRGQTSHSQQEPIASPVGNHATGVESGCSDAIHGVFPGFVREGLAFEQIFFVDRLETGQLRVPKISQSFTHLFPKSTQGEWCLEDPHVEVVASWDVLRCEFPWGKGVSKLEVQDTDEAVD